MKKYFRILADQHGRLVEHEITLNLLNNILDRNRDYNPGHPVTYYHIIEDMDHYDKNKKLVKYTHDEATEILNSFGVCIETHIKYSVEICERKGMYIAYGTPCLNCGHIRAWHYRAEKCCDGKCDCENFIVR